MFKNLLLPLQRTTLQVISVRNAHKKYPKVDKKFQAAAESLAARGFLRPNKAWDPPADIEETIFKICTANGLSTDSNFEALDIKFNVLKACYEETGYSVPNSLLYTIESVNDLKEFYMTPVDTTTPYDSLKKIDLPKIFTFKKILLDSIQVDTDTLFKGVSAFPKSSTIVTGLKARKKYQGYNAKRSWP